MPTGAKLVVEALRREGVKVVFGIPGLSNMPIYDELIDYLRNEEIKHILMRHEQGAAHAADGYARVSGRPGVCTATSGPGAMNLVTGLITAYWDNSPVIAITGQVSRSSMGRKSFQEADVMGVMQHIAKYVVQVKEVGEIPLCIKNAFYIATSGKLGPVVIDIPRDILSTKVDEEVWPEEPMVLGYKMFKTIANPDEVVKAAKLLVEAERPLILVGAGVFWSDATEEVMALSELLYIPIVSTLLGKSAIPHDYPLYLGVVGYYGRAEANMALLESDVVLVVGARLSDRTLPSYNDIRDHKKIIVVNIDPTDVMKLPIKADVEIYGDAKKVLSMLVSSIGVVGRKVGRVGWISRVKELKEYYSKYYYVDDEGLKPWKVLKVIRDIVPKDSIITTGVGQHQMWIASFWDVLKPRTLITSGGMGTMGFGLPAAIGAKIAKPDRAVINLDGDGSFLMTMNNLATAVDFNIPVITVVFDNRALGLVKQVQELFFRGRVVGVDFGPSTNYVKLAESFGAVGYDVADYDDLRASLKEALNDSVASVIRVPISRDEFALPQLPPGGSLKEVILHGSRKGY